MAAAAGLAVLLLVAGGCSTAEQTASAGDEAVAKQNWDAAVYHYLQALAEDLPGEGFSVRVGCLRATGPVGEELRAEGVQVEVDPHREVLRRAPRRNR